MSTLLNHSKQIIDSEFFNESPISAFICMNDEHWTIKDISKNIYNLCGFNKEEFISGKLFYKNIIHPDDLQRVIKEIKKNSLSKNKHRFCV